MKVIILLLAVILFGMINCMNTNADVRKPAVAGQFYPADPASLKDLVTRHLSEVGDPPQIDGHIIALIVPHAGLVYSGPIAAYSYRLLENSGVNKIILCGPSHQFRLEGVSVYGPGVKWETPLGMVPCNDALCTRLIEQSNLIDAVPAAHRNEHCLEVQLPYLQTVLKDFTIVPIIMGRPDVRTITTLADALQAIEFDSSTVMVASTDWQHYLPAAEGRKYDSLGLDCLEKLDADRLMRYLAEDKTQMCGGAPAVSVIKAAVARGADRVKILKYGDSGDVTGDKSSVVSYVAAVLYKSAPEEPGTRKTGATEHPDDKQLTDDDKRMLLTIARKTIERYLETGETPEFEVADRLRRPGAAFVTLNKRGQLRGCIGQTVAVRPLHETVAYCAIEAAVSDPRFPPVTSDELDDIHIEISVLTPLQRISALDEIEVGRDGLMIVMGNYRGLLLPQVATDYGWDRTEFLQQTCRKAGLPRDAYTSDRAEIYRFQAVIFEE